MEQHYNLEGAMASKSPSTSILIGPRVGFNWDVGANKKYQLRGGAGIFTSRVPWAWAGGLYIRNGLGAGSNSGVSPFYATPNDWATNLANSESPSGRCRPLCRKLQVSSSVQK